MKFFRELILAHPGKRICVMGGAPSLAEDVKRIRADVWISVNDHGAKLREVDYILAMDDVHGSKGCRMRPYLRAVSDAPIIGPWPDCEYILHQWPGYPRKYYSGLVAIWAAWAMGGWPVLVAGFDQYASAPSHNRRAKMQAQTVADLVNGPVRVLSGSLSDYFTEYVKGERLGPFVASSGIEGLLGQDGEIVVKCRKPSTIRGHEWPAGTELTVLRHEVKRLLKHRMVVEV